ncbi:MAG: hypothetical protein HYT16_02785 [DPANN group archaeon]|nr:hypothetical protein [DPANN group archaeon]
MNTIAAENYLRRLGAEMHGTHSEEIPFSIYKIGGMPVTFYLYNDRLEVGLAGRSFYKGRIELSGVADEIALDVAVLSWTAERKYEHPSDEKLFETLESFVLGKHGIKLVQETQGSPAKLVMVR